MRKYHVRFGGGRLKKEPQGHLVSRLPNTTEMSRKQADWIDRRLRQTTGLGEASALVANDIVANLPPPERPFVIVVEVCGGSLQGVYADLPDQVLVVLVDHDDAELDPENGARPFEVKPLAALDNVCKAVMFDAGIAIRRT